MRRTRGRGVEVQSLAEFDRRVAAGAWWLRGWRVQGVDFSERTAVLARVRLAGTLFVGCTFGPGGAALAEAGGAIVVPDLPSVPVEVHRDRLYAPRELYDTPSYAASLDARAYAWSQHARDTDASLARALHDHAIDDALAAWVADRRLVGVMGGHALERGSPGYREAALLGLRLGAARVIATGGGPGAMEAANLGGYLAGLGPADDVADGLLDEALAVLAGVPSFRPSVDAWVSVGFAVRDRWPGGADSLGIPTWFYGHEPPNVLASVIAKYVRNAQREAVLLEVCNAGIVFLPGAGGTVQEVFQDACENYYADESSVAPMVLVGTAYWNEELPAWPLLRALAAGRPMEAHVHLVDDVTEAVALFGG